MDGWTRIPIPTLSIDVLREVRNGSLCALCPLNLMMNNWLWKWDYKVHNSGIIMKPLIITTTIKTHAEEHPVLVIPIYYGAQCYVISLKGLIDLLAIDDWTFETNVAFMANQIIIISSISPNLHHIPKSLFLGHNNNNNNNSSNRWRPTSVRNAPSLKLYHRIDYTTNSITPPPSYTSEFCFWGAVLVRITRGLKLKFIQIS